MQYTVYSTQFLVYIIQCPLVPNLCVNAMVHLDCDGVTTSGLGATAVLGSFLHNTKRSNKLLYTTAHQYLDLCSTLLQVSQGTTGDVHRGPGASQL